MQISEEKMLENIEHCIKNFNGRLIDCIAIGNIYIKYLEQKKELKDYKSRKIYQAQLIEIANKDKELEIKDKMIDEIKLELREYLGFENRLKRENRIPDEFNQGRFYVAQKIKNIINGKKAENG